MRDRADKQSRDLNVRQSVSAERLSPTIDAAQCLVARPGTAIFADQRLAHAGWPGHTTGTRFMLVAYL